MNNDNNNSSIIGAMNKPSADKLTELVEHNKKMLRDARAGNWETLAENEIIRQQMIRAFYSSGVNTSDKASIANATRELLLVNEELTKLVTEARDMVGNELAELGKGKIAINAYVKHMR